MARGYERLCFWRVVLMCKLFERHSTDFNVLHKRLMEEQAKTDEVTEGIEKDIYQKAYNRALFHQITKRRMSFY